MEARISSVTMTIKDVQNSDFCGNGLLSGSKAPETKGARGVRKLRQGKGGRKYNDFYRESYTGNARIETLK